MTEFTKAQFVSKLKADGYPKAGGAKTAVGRSKSMSEEDKAECYKSIDKYFGPKVAKTKVLKAKKEPKEAKASKKVTKRTSAEKSESPMERIVLAHARVGTVNEVLNAFKVAKEMYKELDVSKGIAALQVSLVATAEELKGTITPTNGTVSPAISKFAAAASSELGIPVSDSSSV